MSTKTLRVVAGLFFAAFLVLRRLGFIDYASIYYYEFSWMTYASDIGLVFLCVACFLHAPVFVMFGAVIQLIVELVSFAPYCYHMVNEGWVINRNLFVISTIVSSLLAVIEAILLLFIGKNRRKAEGLGKWITALIVISAVFTPLIYKIYGYSYGIGFMQYVYLILPCVAYVMIGNLFGRTPSKR